MDPKLRDYRRKHGSLEYLDREFQEAHEIHDLTMSRKRRFDAGGLTPEEEERWKELRESSTENRNQCGLALSNLQWNRTRAFERAERMRGNEQK